MSDAAANYRLNESKAAKRLDEFASSPTIANLEHEIALARTLAEEAANNGNHVLVRDLLNTTAKLVTAHRQQLERDSEVLNKRVLAKLGSDICDLISSEFQDVENWENRMVRVAEKLAETIGNAKNPTMKIVG